MASPSTTPRPDRPTLLAFGAVVLCGGLNAIAVRQTVLELDPFWGAAIRFLAAGLIFAALTVGRGRGFPRGRSLVGAALYGAIGFAAAFGLVYPALRTLQAGTAAIVLALSPLATYALAVGQRQERYRPEAVLGALIALVGIAVVFADQLGDAIPLVPLVLVLLGMICLSEAGIIVKWLPRSDPFATNAVAMLTAGVMLLGASLVAGETQSIPTQPRTWLAVSYITIFGSVVMFGLYLFGLGRWTASGMSYSTLLLPFVSVAAAGFLTGETFSIAFLVGGAVMIVGVYVGAFSRIRPGRSSATSLPECIPVADCPDAGPRRVVAPGRADA